MTAFVHDPAFCAEHAKPGHPERPARLDHVQLPDDWTRLPLRPATDDELLAVHTPAYLARLAATRGAAPGMLDPDTYHGPRSEEISRAVSGGLVDLALAVWRGEHRRGMTAARPPGHHATAGQPMGFCLHNHIAVAAAAVRASGAQRVAILDFDVHHGNGTQDIFYEDAAVFFASSHQYPHYPGTGAAGETGAGDGAGFTLNVPLDAGAGDVEFLAAWRETLLPAVEAFGPEMILVSAGFDAHVADPLAGLNVTTAGFDALIGDILALADRCSGGKAVFLLEGGYDPVALGECVDALTRRLA